MVNPQSTGDSVSQAQLKAFSEEEKTNFYTGKNEYGATVLLQSAEPSR